MLITREIISISEPVVDKTFCEALFFLKIFSKLILSISLNLMMKLSIKFWKSFLIFLSTVPLHITPNLLLSKSKASSSNFPSAYNLRG